MLIDGDDGRMIGESKAENQLICSVSDSKRADQSSYMGCSAELS